VSQHTALAYVKRNGAIPCFLGKLGTVGPNHFFPKIGLSRLKKTAWVDWTRMLFQASGWAGWTWLFFPRIWLSRLNPVDFSKIWVEPVQPNSFSKIWVEPAQPSFFCEVTGKPTRTTSCPHNTNLGPKFGLGPHFGLSLPNSGWEYKKSTRKENEKYTKSTRKVHWLNPNFLKNKVFWEKIRIDSGWRRVARDGSGAKAPPLAVHPYCHVVNCQLQRLPSTNILVH